MTEAEFAWRQVKFKDFVTLQRGFDLPKSKREKGQYPIVASTTIDGFHSEYKVESPCVVTGRSGALGKVQFVKTPCWPLNTTLWVKDFKNNDPRFVYYLLGTLQLEKYNAGAGVPTLNRNHLDEIDLLIPSVSAQKNIATKLAIYDDLIENNSKRITLLEETAQLIYREWFIHYRFPNHEKEKMVDTATELGEVPEGWEMKEIGDVVETLGGGTPSTTKDEFWQDGEINWYSPVDLTRTGSMFMRESKKKITELGLDKSAAKLFPAFSVMLTSRATVGEIAINTTPACTNQGFITCIPNEKVSMYQIYFWLEQMMPTIMNLATGATFKEITKSNFRKLPILLLPKQINDQFVEVMKPIFEMIRVLEEKNDLLKETRDLLLPKLITGQLAVV